MEFRAWHKEKNRWFHFRTFTYCDEYNLLAWKLDEADEDPDGPGYCNLGATTEDWTKIELLTPRPR